jgi:hypothetical protein
MIRGAIDVAELKKRVANNIDAILLSKLEVRVFHQPLDREDACVDVPATLLASAENVIERSRHRMSPFGR